MDKIVRPSDAIMRFKLIFEPLSEQYLICTEGWNKSQTACRLRDPLIVLLFLNGCVKIQGLCSSKVESDGCLRHCAKVKAVQI